MCYVNSILDEKKKFGQAKPNSKALISDWLELLEPSVLLYGNAPT